MITISYSQFSDFIKAVRLNTPKRKRTTVYVQPIYHDNGRTQSAHIALTANGDDTIRALIFRVGDALPVMPDKGHFGSFDDLKVQTTLALDIIKSELTAKDCDHEPGLVEFDKRSGLLGDPGELWVLDGDGVKRATVGEVVE